MISGIAVIIPFFQREHGMLVTAVRSALTQEGVGRVTVVICDDGSPISAETELAALKPAERERVLLLRQPNLGAGAARNSALDAVSPDTEWIAFLDSDDRWAPQHLARAVATLQEGYDLCFADARREHEVLTQFQGAEFDPREYDQIGSLPDLYRFTGDFLTLNISLSPVAISTVVMRASTLGDLRFRSMAFEDLVYWFEAARRHPRVAFDGTLQVHYGRGNITIAESWKSQGALKNSLSYHRVFMLIAREFKLTSEQRSILERRMARNRKSFSMAILGLIRDGQAPALRVVIAFLRLDLRLVSEFTRLTVTEVARRLPFCRRVLRPGDRLK